MQEVLRVYEEKNLFGGSRACQSADSLTEDGMSKAPIRQPPRKVLLFSGHMIDFPDRKLRRFPPEHEAIAAAAIGALIAHLGVRDTDLAISGAACGGDLLFAEACLARNMSLELYVPFDERTFLAESVDVANADWRRRYCAAKSRATLHIMPDELGPPQPSQNPYEQLNSWMLNAASRFGWERVDFVCLWNGQGGDGPGGTKDLLDQVLLNTERIHWIDTRALWD